MDRIGYGMFFGVKVNDKIVREIKRPGNSCCFVRSLCYLSSKMCKTFHLFHDFQMTKTGLWSVDQTKQRIQRGFAVEIFLRRHYLERKYNFVILLAIEILSADTVPAKSTDTLSHSIDWNCTQEECTN